MQPSAALAQDPHALFSELLADCPPVDLSPSYVPPVPCETPRHLPRRTEDAYEDPEDDYASDGADSSHPIPLLPAKRRASALHVQSPEQRRRDHHNTHTRRCRARLNWRFDALNRMLPAPQNAEVKHKVHILDHAIVALKALQLENEQLQLLVALRSNAAILNWIHTFAPHAPDAVSALKPVIDMLTFVGGWSYAEIWSKRPNSSGAMQIQHFSVKSSPLLEPDLSALGRHAVQSHALADDSDMVARVLMTGSAQWSNNVMEQCRDPSRQQMLANARLRTCLAVPVAIDGEITHVVAVYDIRERPEDSKLVEFASFVAVMAGNAFGAAQAQLAYEAKIQATPRVTPKKTTAPKTPRVTPKAPRLTV